MKERIFLAHSSQDKAFVREFYNLLKLDGFDPWLDEEKLRAGQNWKDEIQRAIEAADAVAVFLSDKTVTEKGYLHKELAEAIKASELLPEGQTYLLPVRIDWASVPDKLKHLQWLDTYTADLALSYLDLRIALVEMPSQPDNPYIKDQYSKGCYLSYLSETQQAKNVLDGRYFCSIDSDAGDTIIQ